LTLWDEHLSKLGAWSPSDVASYAKCKEISTAKHQEYKKSFMCVYCKVFVSFIFTNPFGIIFILLNKYQDMLKVLPNLI
jgi:hypothetical protein